MRRMALVMLLLAPALAGAQQMNEPRTISPPSIATAPSEGPAGNLVAGTEGTDVPSSAAPTRDAQVIERELSPRYRPVTASPGGWFGDVGFYVLRPQWSGGNPAFAVATTTTTVIPGIPAIEEQVTTIEQTEFDHGYHFAPLVSIGYAGRNGLGVRARWWTLDSSESVGGSAILDDLAELESISVSVPSLLGTTALLGSIADQVSEGADGILTVQGSFRSRLDLDVIDAEGIWDTTLGRSSLLVSAGVRYAHLGQSFDGEIDLASNVGAATAALRSLHSFDGAGPTVAIHAHRLIGQTNLSIYGLSRGSLLYGQRRDRASVVVPAGRLNDADPILYSISRSASATTDSLRPVMELEVGGNWTRNVGVCDLFAESGFVGMVWFNAGNAAQSDALIGSDWSSVGSDSAHHNLGLVGLRFSAGVRF